MADTLALVEKDEAADRELEATLPLLLAPVEAELRARPRMLERSEREACIVAVRCGAVWCGTAGWDVRYGAVV